MIVSGNFARPKFDLLPDVIGPAHARARLARITALVSYGKNRHAMVLLTLEEAESLRYLSLTGQLTAAHTQLQIVLCSPAGYIMNKSKTSTDLNNIGGGGSEIFFDKHVEYLRAIVKPSEAMIVGRSSTKAIPTLDSMSNGRNALEASDLLFSCFQILRLFNGDFYFSATESACMVKTLGGLENLNVWVDYLLKCRPRQGLTDVNSLEGSVKNILPGGENIVVDKKSLQNKLQSIAYGAHKLRSNLLRCLKGSNGYLEKYSFFKVQFSSTLGSNAGENGGASRLKQDMTDAILKLIGRELRGDTKAVVVALVDYADADKNGSVTLEEFLTMILEPTPADEIVRNRSEVLQVMKSDAFTVHESNNAVLLKRNSNEPAAGVTANNGDKTVPSKNGAALNTFTSVSSSNTDSLQLPVIGGGTATTTTTALPIPAYHMVTSLSGLSKLVVANGENFILHTGVTRSPANSFSKTATVPCGIMLVPSKDKEKFFFEIEVLKSNGGVSVGWIDALWQCHPTDDHAWTLSVEPAVIGAKPRGGGGGSTAAAVNLTSNGVLVVSKGDIIGCLIDLKR